MLCACIEVFFIDANWDKVHRDKSTCARWDMPEANNIYDGKLVVNCDTTQSTILLYL